MKLLVFYIYCLNRKLLLLNNIINFILINEISSRCVFRLKPGHKVDFSTTKLCEILGFEAKIIAKDILLIFRKELIEL
jgi:hypothetical protein